MFVILGDDFQEQVERTRGEDHVVDLGQRRDGVRYFPDVTRNPDTDHGFASEPHPERVRDRDDLHDSRVEQSLDPLAYRGLGQAHRGGHGRVGTSAVLLELLDDRFVDVVEEGFRRRPGATYLAWLGHRPPDVVIYWMRSKVMIRERPELLV